MPDSLTILGVRVDKVGWSQIDEFCRQALEGTKSTQIVTVNGEFMLEAQQNQKFRDVINAADLVIPDSTNVVWASRLQGNGLAGRTPGSDLTERLSGLAASMGKSIYLLGGRGETPKRAAEALKQTFPGLIVAGYSNADLEDPATIADVQKAKPDIVFVGCGAPKQELWIDQYRHQIGAKIFIGVGGTFLMLSGEKPRAPKLLRSLSLEWLWRLILEPRRISRIWNAVVVFPLKAIFH